MTRVTYEAAIQSTKKTVQMAVTKFMLSLLGWIGFPMLGISWLANMDNIKSTIIFIVSLSMVLVRSYYWIISARQKRRMKDLDIEEREIELIERRRDVRLSRPAGEENEP